MEPVKNGKTYKYWAFISYSSKDNNWGKWLIHAIEKYRIPRSLVGLKTSCGVIPSRLYPVFRDRDELRAGADVDAELTRALDQSHYLIVLCSPNSADPSSWVNTEITHFKSRGRENDVLALILEGIPFSSDQPGSEAKECFPAALRHRVDPNGQLTTDRAEPLAADLTREDKNPRASRRKAMLKLIARMIDVDFDALEQRDRSRRRKRIAAWSVTGLSLLIAFGWLAILWIDATRISTSQELAKQAKEMVQNEKDLGALLAIHANAFSPTPAAYDALLSSASDNPHLLTFLHRGIDVSAIAITQDGQLAAVADCADNNCEFREIHVYDLETFRHTRDPVRVDTKGISQMMFHSDGEKLLVVTSGDETHQLLEFTLNQPAGSGDSLYKDIRPIISASSSPDGRYYGVVLGGGEFKVFDRKQGGRTCGDFFESRNVNVVTTFSPSGTLFALGSEQTGKILLVDTNTCKTSPLNHMRLSAIAFDSEGERLSAIMPDGTIGEWEISEENFAKPKRLNTYHATGFMLNGFLHEFSRDARRLASKHDNEIRVFDIEKHRQLAAALKEMPDTSAYISKIKADMKRLQIASLRGHMDSPRLFRFNGHGDRLVSVDNQQIVILWDIKGNPLVEDFAEGSPFEAAPTNATEAKSIDGHYYAKVSEETEGCDGDYTLECKRWTRLTLFDSATGLQIKTLVTGGNDNPGVEPPWIKFTEAGKVIVGRGTSQQLWNIDQPYLLKRACQIANRSLTITEQQTYLGSRQWLAKKEKIVNCQ